MQGRDDVAGFIAGLRRRRPLHRRLPGRGGPAAPARARPQLPAADLHPGPAERPAVRRRHRPGRRQGHAGGAGPRRTCSWSRSTTAAAGTATTTSSRTCCGRTCWTSSPTEVADLHRRASAWYEQQRRAVRGDPPRAGRRGRRARGGPGRAGHPGAAPEPAGGHAPRLARRRSPTRSSASGRCSAVGFVGALMAGGEFEGVEARLRDAERWLDADRAGAERRTPPAGMVVVDEEEFAASRGRSQMYRAALALVRGDVPATIGHARRALDLAAEDDHLRRGGGGGAPGARALDERGPRGRAPRVRRRRWRAAAGRAHLRRPRLLDHAGRHPDRAGSPRRGAAHLRAGAATRRRAGRAGAAGHGGHARGPEPDRLRARRPGSRHAAPAAQPGAGRAHRAAAEPVPLAGRDGPDPGGRGRPGRRARPARRGASACTWATSPRTCGRSRR